jgi:hypothetical protein
MVSVRLSSIANDSTHGAIVLGVSGDKAITTQWVNGQTLLLSCPLCHPDEVNFEATKVGEVRIKYDINLQVN